MQQKLDEENVAMAGNYFGQVREFFGNKKSMHTAQTVKELKIINKSSHDTLAACTENDKASD